MPQPIPVIDLTVATRSTAPEYLLRKVKAATETTGVIQVINHRVPQHLINDFNLRIAHLLNQPRPRKERLTGPPGQPFRGWRRQQDDFGRLEIERFDMAQFDNAAHARASGVQEGYQDLYAHPNIWPEDDPRLHYTAYRYLEASRQVAERVLGLYGRAQGLPADSIPVSDLPHLSLTVSSYPAWPYPQTGNDEDKLLLLEQTDGSAVTVVSQEGEQDGIQIQHPDGEWITVPVVPGALLIFSGTLLSGWTGGRLRPARHRVVAGNTVPRRSTSVFYHPALDTDLSPLPRFTRSGQTPAADRVTTWDLVKDSPAASPKIPGQPRPARLAGIPVNR
jgi:isopenicillin N synthase-like dioxygenase